MVMAQCPALAYTVGVDWPAPGQPTEMAEYR